MIILRHCPFIIIIIIILYIHTRSSSFTVSVQTLQSLSKEDVPTWCKQFYYDFIS